MFVRRLALTGTVVVTTALLAVPQAQAAAPAYTALGDSHSCAVGTREYYADSGGCQPSPYAHPVIDAGLPRSSPGGPPTLRSHQERTPRPLLGAALTFAARGSAKTPIILSGQLGSLNASTACVTVSAGGNDIGWSAAIVQCATPWPYTCWGDIDRAEAYIRITLPGQLDQLYSEIRQRAPNARLVAVGYPKLFNGQEGKAIARISPGEQSRLNSAADLLATTTAARAAANGFSFVDARAAFAGHSVCGNPEWINGTSWPLGESHHPNSNGHVGYAAIVESALLA